jgi:hypothetical protein
LGDVAVGTDDVDGRLHMFAPEGGGPVGTAVIQ